MDDKQLLLELVRALRENTRLSDRSGFAAYNARPSRNGSSIQGMDPADVAEHLLPKDLKDYWAKIKKDYTDSHVDKRMKDAHDMFITGIEKISEDLAKEGKTLSKGIVDAYKGIVQSDKTNKKLHDEVASNLDSYGSKLVEMENLLEQNSAGYTAGMNDKFHKLNKEIGALTVKLNAAGIAVNNISATQVGGPKSRKWVATDPTIPKEYASQIKAASGSVLNIQRTFETKLKESFAGELNARAAVIASLFKFAADIGGRFAAVAESRLQNVLNDTDFTTAIRTGLSPDEMNAWNNANRNTLSLLGTNADSFATESQNAMHSFGLFGKAAMDATTKLNKISFDSGIGASVANNVGLQDIAGRLQALQGISQDEAVQQVTDAASNMNYYLAAAGKTDSQQLAILNNQAFNLTRIARSSGFSAQYMQGLYEEARNKRFGSVIDQIKTAVTMPVYLDQLEALSGQKLSKGEREAFSAVALGAVDTKDESNPIVQTFMGATKRLGPAVSEAMLDSAKALASGNFGAANITPRAIADAVNPSGVTSLQQIGQEGAKASVMSETMGAATRAAAFYDEQLRDSKQSLNWLEKIHGVITKEYGAGISANPFGGVVGNVVGAIGDLGLGALALRGTGLGGTIANVAGRGLSGAGGIVNTGRAALAAASPGVFGSAVNGAGGLWAAGGAAGVATTLAGVGAAGLGGYAIGTSIYDNAIAGTDLGDSIGSGIAHALAIFNIGDARDSIDRQNMVAGLQTDANGNVIMTNDDLTDASRRTAEAVEKQNKMWEADTARDIAAVNKNESETKLAALAAEQIANRQRATVSVVGQALQSQDIAVGRINAAFG